MILILVAAGFSAIVLNKIWVNHHVANKKATNYILGLILALYFSGYCYLCFFYRKPMMVSHVQLMPFWSYREAFEGFRIVRRGVARSILLNVLLTIPLGYFLPALFRDDKHPYIWTILTGATLAVLTELIQFISRTGLCETDDVINNMMGCLTGIALYAFADKTIMKDGETQEGVNKAIQSQNNAQTTGLPTQRQQAKHGE